MDADDNALFAVSFDDGETLKNYTCVEGTWAQLSEEKSGMTKAGLEGISTNVWSEKAVTGQLKYRIVTRWERLCQNDHDGLSEYGGINHAEREKHYRTGTNVRTGEKNGTRMRTLVTKAVADVLNTNLQGTMRRMIIRSSTDNTAKILRFIPNWPEESCSFQNEITEGPGADLRAAG